MTLPAETLTQDGQVLEQAFNVNVSMGEALEHAYQRGKLEVLLTRLYDIAGMEDKMMACGEIRSAIREHMGTEPPY